MSQGTLIIEDGSGAAVLAEINAALANLSTLCSGSTDPSTLAGGVQPLSLWLDTTTATSVLKQRNAANTGWNTLFSINQTTGAINLAPTNNPIFTGRQTLPLMSTKVILETEMLVASASIGTINFDTLNQSIIWYTSNSSGNFTLNIRGDSSNSLNSTMAIGESMSIAFKCSNGSTAYYLNGFQIDGSAVTPKWQGSAPTSGNANAIDVYSIAITKTANATFTALAAQTKFA